MFVPGRPTVKHVTLLQAQLETSGAESECAKSNDVGEEGHGVEASEARRESSVVAVEDTD